MNAPDSKNTQNRPSFSCGLHYVKAFTGWPMLNNAGNSFESLTWCSELDCIFSLPELTYFWLISNKNYNPLIRYQWFGKDCLLILNPFYKCARIKDSFFKQMLTAALLSFDCWLRHREQYLAVSVVSTLLPFHLHNQLLLFLKCISVFVAEAAVG